MIDRPQQLLEFIDNSLKPKEIEKKKFGEVFTPMSLCNQMLDKLPKTVWSNPDLTWFDPASGMGNFPIAVYLRLMVGLTEAIPSESKRKRHILENMLYVSELSRKNMLMYKQIMDIGNKYKMNLCCGDFLTFDSVKQFNLKSFDIVMGNPPYQSGSKDGNIGQRKGGYGGRALWEKFVCIILEKTLSKNGYLVFVHPSSWRKPEHKLWNILSSLQILHLDIHSKKEGTNTFNSAVRYDWYLLQNKKCDRKTTIRDEKGIIHHIDLREWPFLLNYMYDEISKILASEKDKGVNILYSRSAYASDKKWVSSEKSKQYKNKVVHTMTKNGIGYLYTNDTTNGHFNIPKVILSFNEKQYPFDDYLGKYGMSQITYGIPIKSEREGDAIVKAINSDTFREIIAATKWNIFNTEWRMFKYFKKDFYKYFQDKPYSKREIINNSDSEDDSIDRTSKREKSRERSNKRKESLEREL
jgi:hypothetical protein